MLAAENALVMDELNPEVRMYLDAAKKTLKAHFLAEADDAILAFKREWKARIKAFSDMEKKTLLDLLKKSLKKPGNAQ